MLRAIRRRLHDFGIELDLCAARSRPGAAAGLLLRLRLQAHGGPGHRERGMTGRDWIALLISFLYPTGPAGRRRTDPPARGLAARVHAQAGAYRRGDVGVRRAGPVRPLVGRADRHHRLYRHQLDLGAAHA